MIDPEPADAPGGSDSDTFKQNRRSTNGRPPGAKDSAPRRKRSGDRPVTRAQKIWAKSILKNIAEVINPVILQTYAKKNMRSLTEEQSKDAEYMTIGTLFNLTQDASSKDDISRAAATEFNHSLITSYFEMVRETEAALGRSLTADERRDLAAEVYAS